VRGTVVRGHRKRPNRLLELYDAEYNPRCRYLRETLTELDLDVVIYPMPRGGECFRSRRAGLDGKGEVPFLHDPNTGKCLDDAQAIADYPYKEYVPEGQTAPPGQDRNLRHGNDAARPPGCVQPRQRGPGPAARALFLRVQSHARIVRETLCELEIPYILHNVGKG